MLIEEKVIEGFRVNVTSINGMLLGIACDIGPRILYLASAKKPDLNIFGILPNVGIETQDGFWKVYGGHRLWSSPQAKPRTYSIDDQPVKIDVGEDYITIHGNPEEKNFIQKEITIKAGPDNSVQVIHRIKNIGRWPIRMACSAISLMREKGFVIIPIKPTKIDAEGLLPGRHITLWPYTDISDKRLIFSSDYIFVKHDPKVKDPLKIGVNANPSWTAYWVDGMLFLKQFYQESGEYPDFGSTVEVYADEHMLELGTLSVLKLVEPSEAIEHTEFWKVFEIGKIKVKPDNISEKVEPLVKA
ncbi:MAG: hypothetical protein QXH24_01150 [Candidatus Bathyarchaeia archaeon]